MSVVPSVPSRPTGRRPRAGSASLFGLLAAGFITAASVASAAPVSPEGQKAAAPDLAVNARGEVALLWVDRSPQEAAGPGHDHHVALTDLWVAVSRDGGATFGAPTRVPEEAGAVWGQAVSRPRIVGTPNGTWHVAYAANDRQPTSGKPVLATHYTRSVDDGRSFEAPRRISTIAEQDLSGVMHGGFATAAAFGTLAATADGGVHVLWIDTRGMQPDSDSGAAYGVSSSDDGRRFSAERQYMATGVCPCCQLMAVADGRSDLLLGSRKVTAEGFRPTRVTRIAAAGRKQGSVLAEAETGGTPWKIAGCPLKPTALGVHGRHVLAAVHNGAESPPAVVLAASDDGGRGFRALGPVHPGATVSDAPSIAVGPDLALLAWHGKTSGPRRIFYRFLRHDGSPVGEVTELDAAPGAEQSPVVAARADGRFVIAWQQADRVHTAVLDAPK